MSDAPQGPGWWRASDGKYYPPEARPGFDPNDRTSDELADESPHRGARPDEAVVEEGAPVDEAALADEPTLLDIPPVDPESRAEIGDQAEPTDETPPVGEPTSATVINEDLYERDWPVDDEAEPEGRRLWPVLAIVAVVGLLAGLAIWFVLDGDDDSNAAVTTTTADGETPGATTEPVTTLPTNAPVSPYALAEGDCFDAGELADDGSLLVNLRVIECDEPHQAEVVAVEDLEAASDDAFPGDEARDASAQELCTPIVESFLGGPLAESSLLLLWLAPTEETWADGDREVVCVIAAPDGETLTGSAAGTLTADGSEPEGEGETGGEDAGDTGGEEGGDGVEGGSGDGG